MRPAWSYRARSLHDIVVLNLIENECFWHAGRASGRLAKRLLLGLRLLMGLTNESTLRARARKLGYSIHKSRSRSINEDNLGKYALVKEDSRSVVLGERFDASLEEIAEYLS